MKRFKNILAIYNDAVGDDDTLAQATALAMANDAQLTVVEVVKDEGLPLSFFDEKEKRLRRLTASIRQMGIPLKTAVLTGTPFVKIIRYVLRNKHDLVIMTADGEGGYRNLFFGSTTLHIVRKCPCPVWVTKPGAKNDYAQIMAAIGSSSEDISGSKLNATIMDLASSLAQLNKSKLHIVHAWEVTGSDSVTLKSEITKKIDSDILHKHEMRHQQPLERLLEPYHLNKLDHEVHLIRGTPEFTLPQLADTADIDLIVMGTINHTGIAGFLIGNAAESILRQVDCAILAIKPEGFVTPVTLE